MLEFNNQHIFTGFLKQLLANFNLPKDINGELAITKDPEYFYNKKVLNYTKNLKIQNNIYDSYTHEYLGEYLRFQRDYNHLDLMSLYNCFSNTIVSNIDINIKDTSFRFNSADPNYKIYMMPIKYDTEYTFAMETSTPIELCCGLYSSYLLTEPSLGDGQKNKIIKNSYKKYNNLIFAQPELLKIDFPIGDLKNSLKNLKLFIKVPKENKSTIVLLEGNYIGFSDSFLKPTVVDNENIKLYRTSNSYIINFEDSCLATMEDRPFNPIGTLQLLKMNTNKQHPFSDRLIEYMLGMPITNLETITDNVLRAQEVMQMYYTKQTDKPAKSIQFETPGAWSSKMRFMLYGYQTNINTDTLSTDKLGYVDKTMEKYFEGYTVKTNPISHTQIKERHTIENIDIYPDLYKDSKGENR